MNESLNNFDKINKTNKMFPKQINLSGSNGNVTILIYVYK